MRSRASSRSRASTARSSRSDVVIDMYCYRKYGHNENDEPAFTQPLMYDRIKTKQSPVEVYAKRLIERGRRHARRGRPR